MGPRKCGEKMPVPTAHLQNHFRPPGQESGARGAQCLLTIYYSSMMGGGSKRSFHGEN